MAMYNRKQKLEIECKNCKNVFKVLPSRGQRLFCSTSCSTSHKHKTGRIKSPAGWNKGIGQGWTISSNGYKIITVGKNKLQYEHRLVMEKHLGRKLSTNEHVHHIDGNKLNNKIKNLEITNVVDHAKTHYENGHGIAKYNASRMV